MPPREKYNRESIIDAAFELAKEEGLEQISARNIAKRLGCSTQPIYSSFDSIEELEQGLVDRIKHYAQAKVLSYDDSESYFLSIGLGYYSFSQSDPELFSSLFIYGGLKWSFTKEDSFFGPILEKMKKDKFLNQLNDDKLAEIFRDMLIYTHGLTTQSQMSDKPVNVNTARELIKRMGGILIVSAAGSGTEEIERVMRRFHRWND